MARLIEKGFPHRTHTHTKILLLNTFIKKSNVKTHILFKILNIEWFITYSNYKIFFLTIRKLANPISSLLRLQVIF